MPGPLPSPLRVTPGPPDPRREKELRPFPSASGLGHSQRPTMIDNGLISDLFLFKGSAVKPRSRFSLGGLKHRSRSFLQCKATVYQIKHFQMGPAWQRRGRSAQPRQSRPGTPPTGRRAEAPTIEPRAQALCSLPACAATKADSCRSGGFGTPHISTGWSWQGHRCSGKPSLASSASHWPPCPWEQERAGKAVIQ